MRGLEIAGDTWNRGTRLLSVLVFGASASCAQDVHSAAEISRASSNGQEVVLRATTVGADRIRLESGGSSHFALVILREDVQLFVDSAVERMASMRHRRECGDADEQPMQIRLGPDASPSGRLVLTCRNPSLMVNDDDAPAVIYLLADNEPMRTRDTVYKGSSAALRPILAALDASVGAPSGKIKAILDTTSLVTKNLNSVVAGDDYSNEMFEDPPVTRRKKVKPPRHE